MAEGPRGKKEKEVLESFKEWVLKDRKKNGSSELDEGESQDWFSLSLGFFAAKGLGVDACHRLAIHVHYDLHYWNEHA